MKKLLLLFTGLLFVFNLNAQTDSLKKLLTQKIVDTTRFNVLFELSQTYRDSGEIGMQYIHQALELAKKMDNIKLVGSAYHKIGYFQYCKGDYQLAVDSYKKALLVLDPKVHKKQHADVDNDLGLVYKSIGNYDLALSFFIAALDEYSKANYSMGVAMVNNNIGQIYYFQNNFKLAISYFEKYASFARRSGNATSLAGAENNLGGAYSEMGNLAKALFHYQFAFHLYDSLGSRFGVAILNDNIATILYKMGDFKLALAKHLYSYRLFREFGMKEQMIYSGNNIGLDYMGLGKYQLAEKSMKEALSLAIEIGHNEAQEGLYESLSLLYQKTKRYSQALDAYKSYTSIKDSISGKETQKEIAEIQTKYEAAKKEQALLKQQIQIRNQKRMLVYGGAAIFGFAILSTLLITANRKKKKLYVALLGEQRKITESITYASKIQSAVLPPIDLIKQYFPDHFIFYKPRDIVSGDFYWFSVNRSRIYFAAVDCTGHGVPGAFMSILGFTMLNQIVSEDPDLSASQILDNLRLDVKKALHQSGSIHEPHDGMDVALCVLNTDNSMLQYAGAHNPLFLIHEGELVEYAADLMPIGHAGKFESKSFTNHEIELAKGDIIYLFSDGYVDQFGGEDGQKFKRSLFRKTLLSINKQSMSEQERLLGETLDRWKQKNEQVDDILVFGVRY